MCHFSLGMQQEIVAVTSSYHHFFFVSLSWNRWHDDLSPFKTTPGWSEATLGQNGRCTQKATKLNSFWKPVACWFLFQALKDNLKFRSQISTFFGDKNTGHENLGVLKPLAPPGATVKVPISILLITLTTGSTIWTEKCRCLYRWPWRGVKLTSHSGNPKNTNFPTSCSRPWVSCCDCSWFVRLLTFKVHLLYIYN